jgi:hypothetical protein
VGIVNSESHRRAETVPRTCSGKGAAASVAAPRAILTAAALLPVKSWEKPQLFMTDLNSFTVQTFQPLIGQTFRILPAGSEPIEAELIAAEARVTGRERHRDQFSIIFRGPLQPVLPQRIYAFQHETLGAFDLFIVPIGPDEAGMRYEAIFA